MFQAVEEINHVDWASIYPDVPPGFFILGIYVSSPG